MSIRRRWTLLLVGLLLSGSITAIVASSAVAFYGARRQAQEWLRSVFNGSFRSYEGLVFDRLAAEREAVSRLHPPASSSVGSATDPTSGVSVLAAVHSRDIAFLVTESGSLPADHPVGGAVSALRSSFASGAGRGFVRAGRRVYLVCVDPEAAFAGRPFWATAHELDRDFLHQIRRVTGSEVVLFDERGVVSSTFEGQGHDPVEPRFPAESLASARRHVPSFGVTRLSLPDYAGYRSGTRPFAVGATTIEAYLYTARLSQHLPVSLGLVVPTVAVRQGAYYNLIVLVGLTILFVPAIVLIAWRLAGRLMLPLHSLAEAAQRVAGGDLSVQVPERGAAGLSEVGRSFNAMVRRVEQSRERLMQHEKMAAMGRLAGGLAHEINNPLAVIVGFAQGLARRIPEGHPAHLPVNSIVRESLRCKELVSELLVFARNGATGDEEIAPNELCRSVAVLLRPRAGIQAIEILLALDGTVPAVRGNRIRLQQVLVNLATNAMDAMPAGGSVTIRTRTAIEGGVAMDVCDTGPGIPAEVRGRIFEPFFTTKEAGRGTGLGLSFVYETVRQHGGEVGVDSEPGRGTTFTVRLPAASNAEAAAA